MTRPRVLIVDDSPTQALRLQIALEEEGWEILLAATPEQALALLVNEQFELAVIDFYLPGMQGDELCRLIRMNLNTRSLPLMMLTVADNDEFQRKGLDSGADDYLPKSADLEVLLIRLRSLIRKSPGSGQIVSNDSYSGKGRLLVVDDSATYREYLVQQLSKEGHTVVGADGADHARQCLAQNAFDVILVDLMMPEVDGIELCRELDLARISQRNPFAILMLTAHEGKGEMTRGLEAGADDFVGKSSEPAVLRARIRALLRRKYFQEENLRISRELKDRELETTRAQAERATALAKASLVEELEAANHRLRKTQVQLIHSEKMASLGQLVAGIAHELNNPLAFVSNTVHNVREWLKTLESESQGLLSESSLRRWEKTNQRMGSVAEGLDRMGELILKLRTFSRLDEGEFKVVDVHQGLESVLVLVRHRMKPPVHLVRAYCDEMIVGCFPGQLNQVFLNLLSNALDAIDGAGTITVATHFEAQHGVITVSDTGSGVSPDNCSRVFDPFFTTKPVGQGMGLGLAISYSIVKAHRGRIELHSSPDQGASFAVWIPLDLEERLAQKQEEPPR